MKKILILVFKIYRKNEDKEVKKISIQFQTKYIYL